LSRYAIEEQEDMYSRGEEPSTQEEYLGPTFSRILKRQKTRRLPPAQSSRVSRMFAPPSEHVTVQSSVHVPSQTTPIDTAPEGSNEPDTLPASDPQPIRSPRKGWLHVLDASTTSEHERNVAVQLDSRETVGSIVRDGLRNTDRWERIQRLRLQIENLRHERERDQEVLTNHDPGLRERATRTVPGVLGTKQAEDIAPLDAPSDVYTGHLLLGVLSFPSANLLLNAEWSDNASTDLDEEWLKSVCRLVDIPSGVADVLLIPVNKLPLLSEWNTCMLALLADYELDCNHRRMLSQYELLTIRNEDSVDNIEGLGYFDEGMRLLDCFSFVRSADQRRFHDAIMMTMARHILKDDYLMVREQLLRRFNMSAQNMATLILCPRRWGKSTSVAMVLAVLLRVCRGIDIVIFSTGEDSSATLLQMTKDFYLQLPGAEKRITVNRRGMICTLPADVQSMSTLKQANKRSRMNSNTLMSRSGNVTGNRGITADCFILEEAAFIPREILTQIIAPMLKVSNSVLIALSTHNGEENYYSRLFNDTDPVMDRLFIRLRVELVCATCKRLGRNPSQCTHVAHLNPAWLLASNEDRVKKLMGGDKETYAREVLGAFWADNNTVFKKKWLDCLDARVPFSVDGHNVAMIVTMIDPAGGGSSMTAFVTIARTRSGEIVILGLAEANVIEGPDLERVMFSYMSHFKMDISIQNLPHYLCIERNYGGSLIASTFLTLAQKICPNITEYVDIPEKIFHANTDSSNPVERTHGVWTSADVKRNGVITLAWELHDGRVHFAPYVATSVNVDDVHENIECGRLNRDRLLDQLSHFHKKFKSNGSWYYTGKDGRGGRDDLAICLVLVLHHSYVIGTTIQTEDE
jgi:hypothetical protein